MSETDREFDEVWPARDGRCQIDIPFECREGPWVTDLKTHFRGEQWGLGSGLRIQRELRFLGPVGRKSQPAGSEGEAITGQP